MPARTRTIRNLVLRLLLLTGAAFAALCAVIVGVLYISAPQCEHQIEAITLSPDGTQQAAVDYVGCGATVGYTSWLLLAPAGEDFAPKKHQIAIFEGQIASLSWQDDATLTVRGNIERVGENTSPVQIVVE